MTRAVHAVHDSAQYPKHGSCLMDPRDAATVAERRRRLQPAPTADDLVKSVPKAERVLRRGDPRVTTDVKRSASEDFPSGGDRLGVVRSAHSSRQVATVGAAARAARELEREVRAGVDAVAVVAAVDHQDDRTAPPAARG